MQKLLTFSLAILCWGTIEAATPPCSTAAYQDWHFWLGTWSVTSLSGQAQGTNSITLEENGCLMVERWRNVQGGTGQSYNFYNPAKKEWRQVWVSPGVIIDYTGGLNQAGAMVLEGTITYHANQQELPFRGSWSLRADGTVLQEFAQYNPDTSQWDNWFTGVYTKITDEDTP